MKTIHKYDRRKGAQYVRCTGVKCTMSESVSWFWGKVKCKACWRTKGMNRLLDKGWR